jgi:hypothetical protein
VEGPRAGLRVEADVPRGGEVADDRSAACSKDGAEVEAFAVQVAVADREDAAVEAVEAAGLHPARDRRVAQANLAELASTDHAVLKARKLRDSNSCWACLCPDMGGDRHRRVHGADDRPPSRTRGAMNVPIA